MKPTKEKRLAFDPFIGRGVDGLIRSTAPEEPVEPIESTEPDEPIAPPESVESREPLESTEPIAPSAPDEPIAPTEPKIRRSISFSNENMTHLQLMAGFRNMSIDKYIGELCQADRSAKAALVLQLKKLKGE